MAPESADHHRISPSAWGVAYQRTLTDIPLSQEVFDELDALARKTRSAAEASALDDWKFPMLTPMFEARFKLLNVLLNRQGAKNILEIGSGFSTRGMTMTQNPGVTYVELDLPEVLDEKRLIIDSLIRERRIGVRPNLHLQSGNVLADGTLEAATESFGPGPIIIVHEGLLRYFSHEEKSRLAISIHQLLADRGGEWMTPDVCAKGMNARGAIRSVVREQNERLRALTGMDVRKNYFGNEAEAREFFESKGFSVQRHSFAEVAGSLESPANEGLTEDQVADSIGDSAVYVMTPRL